MVFAKTFGCSKRQKRNSQSVLWLLPQGCGLLLTLAASTGLSQVLPDLASLSLEELTNLEITSVSRRAENISGAPASIFVITAEDIRRSGATTIPEILRLAPNLQVARIDSMQYAITARGFNNTIGNKLLVLMDGRTIYTPLFSGVFWEMQDTFLQDIERIEVISGPGATLWGANAVNGVINIITRSAAETSGMLLSGEAGDRENGVAIRAGGKLGDNLSVRVFAKAREWDNTRLENGAVVRDNWDRQQIGFRADWNGGKQNFTVQGDAYEGESEHRGFVGPFELTPQKVSGANLLTRWTRQLDNGSEFRIQAYWTHPEREEIVLFSPSADILDIEFQHSMTLQQHRLVWGGGYRHGSDDVAPGLFTAFIPDSTTLAWENIFVQDEVHLTETLRLIPGLKLEWNDYTGMEYLPSLRLAWAPSPDQMIWSAVSRAVRAPSRFDRDIYFPMTPPFIVAGGPNFVSEVAKVLEVGYRGQVADTLNLSATLYLHAWDKLRSGTPLPVPTYLVNSIEGDVYGVELWANWQLTPWWRLSGGLTTLEKDLQFSPGGGDTAGVSNATLHNDPDSQWKLRSSMDLGNKVQLDLHLIRVDELTVQPVPAYTELYGRLSWLLQPGLELTLTGRNLIHNDHAEFGAFASRSRVDRSVLMGLRWTF